MGMPFALGVDLGGTKILAGVVNAESGEVRSCVFHGTRTEGGDILRRLVETCREAIVEADVARGDIVGVGIGVAGQIDSPRGVIVRAPNLPDELVGFPIGSRLTEELHLPATVVNDVVAAAAGEASFGAGQDHPDFVCVFVGTGIGGAVYRGGAPYWGATHTAGELGHMVIDYDGRICGCGGKGHLEAYASRSAIVRTILAALHQGRPSSLAEVAPNPDPNDVAHSPIHDVQVDRAIKSGDELALEMVRDGARYMAAGLVSIVNFYNPRRIILGGGMVENVEAFFELVRVHTVEESLQVPRTRLEIVKAGLGDRSGVVGAAVLACGR
jgi:glucokinase